MTTHSPEDREFAEDQWVDSQADRVDDPDAVARASGDPDPNAEQAKNDRLWGPGNWVHCPDCQGAHHRDYHANTPPRDIHSQ